MPEAVVYPTSIDTDKEKLFAVYRLIEEMRLEHNRQASEAHKDYGNLAAKFKLYQVAEFKPRLKLLLAEKDRLVEKIRWDNFTLESWRQFNKLDEHEQGSILEGIFGLEEVENEKPTLATSALLDELKSIDLSKLSQLGDLDPTEDFTSATWNSGTPQSDPNSRLTVISNQVTVAGMKRNEEVYHYGDYGAAYFDGDFEHLIEFNLVSGDTDGIAFCYMVSNDNSGTYTDIDANSGSLLAVRLWRRASSRLYIHELDSGIPYNTYYAGISLNTLYYPTLEKDEGVGSYGTFYLYLYSDASRETLVTTKSLTLHTSLKDYRYLYNVSSQETGHDFAINTYHQDFDLQEAVTHEGSAILSGTGTLLATAILIRSSSATLAGTGTLTAAATVIEGAVYGTATLSGTGTLTAKAGALRPGAATFSGTGSLAAQAGLIQLAAAVLTGTGSLTAQGILIGLASATLAGTGTLAAAAGCIRLAVAMVQGIGSLSAIGFITGLTATLLAAQKKAHRLPYVEAKVYDYEQGIKRLSWTRLYEGSEPDNHHGLAFDAQGSLHRIRAAASNTLYRQKVTSPDPSSDYSQWTQIATDCAGPCAIAAYGAKVYIFYKTTGNVIWKYYSHDYGQTWDNAQLVSYADVLSLATCWWGTGDIVVCFALKSDELNGIVLDTSDQTTSQHIKEFHGAATHIFLDTYGIGATYNPFWPCCEIVLAAKESDSPYTHHDLWRTWFSDSYNFLALESFLMSPDGEDVTYEYPDCHLPASAQSYETNRIVAVEKFTGTTAYTRPLACHMVKGTYWSDTAFTEPKPFLDLSSSYGLRLQSTSDYWWLERPDGVWRAPRPVASPLDLTGDIVTLLLQNVIASPGLSGRGNLVIELNNSKGQYASPGQGALASLRFRSEIVLKLGYKTSQGNEAVDAGSYWIDSWEYRSATLQGRATGTSTFILTCLDGWGLMDRWTARYQMRWNKYGVNPKSVWQVLYQLLARVGIKLTNTPPKPQSSAINNFYPDFAINPGTRGDSAIRRLLSFIPDQLVFRGQEAFTKNPLASESSCYSYGTDHAILAGNYCEQVFTSRARAIGRDVSDNRILEEALDWDLLQLSIDILEQDYDPNLQSATRAQERADAILRKMSLRAERGNLVIPTNVGQEPLDVVEVTDERCGISEENYRVQAIQTDLDRRHGIYSQRLALCAP